MHRGLKVKGWAQFFELGNGEIAAGGLSRNSDRKDKQDEGSNRCLYLSPQKQSEA